MNWFDYAQRRKLVKGTRNLIKTICVLYLIALTVYLPLRFIIGDGVWWLSMINAIALMLFVPLIIIIPILGLLRSRFVLLGAAMVGVCVVWLTPYYLPKAVAASDHPTLKVITFNMWRFNPDVPRLESWLREKQADMVFLQEITPEYAADEVKRLADVYPYQAVQTWGGGNLILSKHPILEWKTFPSQENGGAMMMRAAISYQGQDLALYSVHLSRPSVDTQIEGVSYVPNFIKTLVGYDDTSRNSQIQQLLDLTATETVPYLVAGDFNMSDQCMVYWDIRDRMGDTYREAGYGLGASWPVGGVNGRPTYMPAVVRIDYVWHSSQFRALTAELGPQLGSDHYPVYSELALEK
ncbi:MAG: endonuclease/exonuclease/phosphatase family protein [Anaerolineae bacterium]|nr:endonuclease/exonuclease/phosphatase family protein [Anaerolineae bacterium]